MQHLPLEKKVFVISKELFKDNTPELDDKRLFRAFIQVFVVEPMRLVYMLIETKRE
jgi:hypothetical protein